MATFSASLKGYTLHLIITEDGYSSVSNSSILNWTLKLTSQPEWDFYDHSFGWTVKFNNIVVADEARDPDNLQFDLPANSSVVLATGTATVEHNADGTLVDMPVYAVIDCANLDYMPDGLSVSGTMSLNTSSGSEPGPDTGTNTNTVSVAVYIDNGTSFDAYEAYIDNGAGWDKYVPHIYIEE